MTCSIGAKLRLVDAGCHAAGETAAIGWDDAEAPHVVEMAASASQGDWAHRAGPCHAIPPKKFHAHVKMDRIGQKGMVFVVPPVRAEPSDDEVDAPYAIAGTRNKAWDRLRYTTTLVGHTRVLEVRGGGSDALNSSTCSRRDNGVDHKTEAAGPEVLLHTLIRIGPPASQGHRSGQAGLGLSVVDEARRELVYAHAQGLAVSLSATAESLLIKGNAARLQVDNQSANGPRIALASPWQSEAGVSFLDADLELARSVTSVRYWRRVRLSVGDVRLQLHETVLWGLLQFERACYSQKEAADAAAAAGSAEVDSAAWRGVAKERVALPRGSRHIEGSCDPATGLTPEEAGVIPGLAFLDEMFYLDRGMHFEEIQLPKVAMEVTLQGLQAVKWRPQPVDADCGGVRIVGEAYGHLRVLAASSLGLPDVEGHKMTLPELRYSDKTTHQGGTLVALIWGHYRRTVLMQGLKVCELLQQRRRRNPPLLQLPPLPPLPVDRWGAPPLLQCVFLTAGVVGAGAGLLCLLDFPARRCGRHARKARGKDQKEGVGSQQR